MPAVTDIFSKPHATAPDPLLERLRSVTIGEYEIRGELGRGGMAVVYLAKDIRLERTVAIKVMLPELMRTDGMAERFVLEARISARLQHPNIIIVHDVRQREEIIYFVMGLVDGCGLDEITRAGIVLAIDDVRWVLMQAAQALSYANGEGIVHRDVKPGNILLTVKGDVLVTDFGIAKVVENNSHSIGATIIGTPLYMSPEQVTGQRVSEASDQYALGIAAYVLLTGSPPFSGDLSLYDLATAHVRTRPVPLQTRRPDCPPALAAAVMRMLEKRPAERWPSLQELVPVLADGLPHDGLAIKRRLGAVARSTRDANAQRSQVSSIETPVTPRPGAPFKPKPAMIVVSPPSATLYVATQLELSAKVLTRAGDPIHDAIVAWTSSDTEIVTVTPAGALLGVGPGTACIRAAIGSVYEEALVTVVLSPITQLELAAESLTLPVGAVLRPVVRAIDAHGRYRADAACSWLSRNAGIVQVVGAGELLGVAVGEAAIEVAAGTARATLRLRVTPRPAVTVRVLVDASTIECGDAIALRVEAFDDRGAPVHAPHIAWTSDATHIVHVDSAGTAIGLSPGLAALTAVVDGARGALSLTVVEAPIAAITLTVRPSSLEPGDAAHVELVVTDASGNPRSEDGIAVVSDNAAVVGVLGDGRTLTAVAPGQARIVARVNDPTLAAAVPVTPVVVSVRLPVVDRILLSSPSLDLELGAVVAVSARCQDARRRVLTDTMLSWQSLDPSIARVDARGQVRALTAGETVVRVTASGAHESSAAVEMPVRVRQPAAAYVRVSASTARMQVGLAQHVEALLIESTGATVTQCAPVWSSSDSSIARVSAAGLVEALAPGQVTITAHLDGQRGDLVLYVDQAPVIALAGDQPAEVAVVVPPPRKSGVRRWLLAVGGLAAVAISVLVATREPPSPPLTPPPDGIVIEYQLPQADGLSVGSRLPLRAFSRSGRVPLSDVRWSVSPTSAATIDPGGILLAQKPGTVRVTAMAPTDSVAVATIAIVEKKPVPPTPVTQGTLVVTELPAGGSIRVDGRRISGSRVNLDQGSHAVRLQAPNYVPVNTVVQIGAGETRTLVFDAKRAEVPPGPKQPPGVLMLRVSPFATVFIDDVLAAEDELIVMTLPAGRHAVRLEKPGYATLDTVVTVPPSDTLKRRFTLQPRTP
ncbi:protein kinase domain-containing protein [Gemmatimonas sp.]|uniref:protein kinase domain-containing protein n=1 Tax=Gemmatimonas sp. TaxID=1962908 RepID=UPI0035642ABA